MNRFIVPVILLITSCGQAKPHEDGSAFAEVIKVNVVNIIKDEESVAYEDTKEIMSWAQVIFWRSVDIRIKLISYKEIAASEFSNIDDWHSPTADAQLKRFRLLRNYAAKSGCIEDGVKCYFLLPPLRSSSGNKQFGGVGDFYCSNSGFALGQAGRLSSHSPPRDRLMASAGIMVHEIGHTFNCEHLNVKDGHRVNIMDFAAGVFFDKFRETITFIVESIERIRECTGYMKRKSWMEQKRKRCRKAAGGRQKRCWRRYNKVKQGVLQKSSQGVVFPAFE
ncbi:MAG: hypothetical protein DRI61_06580 [Chloroflexi bacterium]|nr:MAG: hypothetical protein DRI61_06580 [Chloroflexota bacterium]